MLTAPAGVTIEFDAETNRSYWEMHNTSHESLVELGSECYCYRTRAAPSALRRLASM